MKLFNKLSCCLMMAMAFCQISCEKSEQLDYYCIGDEMYSTGTEFKVKEVSSASVSVGAEKVLFVTNRYGYPESLKSSCYLRSGVACQLTKYPDRAIATCDIISYSTEWILVIEGVGAGETTCEIEVFERDTDEPITKLPVTIKVTNTPVSPVTIKTVDLGMVVNGKKVLWAESNLGATSATEAGDYYAWGETSAKLYYGDNSYTWGAGQIFSKYVTDSRYGTVDNKTELEASDDAATVILKDGFRTPSDEEFQMLLDESKFTFEKTTNPIGCKFTSKIPGYEGNYIILPSCGERQEWHLIWDPEIMNVKYATRTLSSASHSCCTLYMYFQDSKPRAAIGWRYHGCQIRPVKEI